MVGRRAVSGGATNIRHGIAPTWRRLAAYLLGLIVLIGAQVAVRALGPEGWYRPVFPLLTIASDVVGVALFGCTLGMWLTRTRVVRPPEPGPPGWRTALVRWVVATGPGLLGYLWWATRITPPTAAVSLLSLVGLVWMVVVFAPILSDDYLRGRHDRVAGTVVILHSYRGSLDWPTTRAAPA